MKRITAPLSKKTRIALKAGDAVLLSGVIFTARDAAHRRFADILKKRRGALPIPLKGACIYYAGPTPPHKGAVIGSCGPTTSSRVDRFTPDVLKAGVTGLIGKGLRSENVRKKIRSHKAVYFLAIAGAGALISTKVKSARPVAYKDLGPEAVYRLEVEDLPLIVGIDARGRDVYKKINTKGAR
ncbi:FumA C-terminus/TtdB family hydratase beta subunit [Candidatus Omnitrophota bacterium]